MTRVLVSRRMKHKLKTILLTGVALSLVLLVIQSQSGHSREFAVQYGPVSKKLLSIKETNFDNEIGTPYRAKRFQSAAEYCEKQRQPITPGIFDHILVNDKYKILYCSIPKVACTNWRRIMLILTGKMNTTDPMKLEASKVHKELNHHLTYLSSYSLDAIKLRLDTYYKFVFTRDPFERILSAFRNKFKGKNPFFHKRYGSKIARRHRTKQSAEVPSGSDVTFYEFVQYLTDFTRRDALNEHWDKMTSLCHPCHVKYDLISPYEDLEVNSDRILDRIGVSKTLKFPKRSMTYKHAGTEKLLRQYYSTIPPVMLDQFMELYYSDFLVFNHTIPASLRNLTKWQVKP